MKLKLSKDTKRLLSLVTVFSLMVTMLSCLCGISVSAVESSDNNLIKDDPSFETGTYGNGTFIQDETVGHTGTKSIKVTASGNWLEYQYVKQATFNPADGSSYRLGIWAKASEATANDAIFFKPVFTSKDAAGNNIAQNWQSNCGYAKLTTDWKYYSYTFSPSDTTWLTNAAEVEINVIFGVTGYVSGMDILFDDICFEKYNNLISNDPSFENDGYGNGTFIQDETVGHTGTKSIKVTASGNWSEYQYVKQAKFNPSDGSSYRLGIWAKASEATVSDAIFFKPVFTSKDAAGNNIAQNWQSNCGYARLTTEWKYYSYIFSPSDTTWPTNAAEVEINVILGMTGYVSGMDIWLDDICFEKHNSFDSGLISNGDLEFGAPTVHQPYNCGTVERTTEDKHNGYYSLKVTPNSDGNARACLILDNGNSFDKTKNYLFSAWIKVENAQSNGGNVGNLWLQTESGSYEQKQRLLVNGNTDWIYVQNILSGDAAQGTYFYIWGCNASYYIDDLKLKEINCADTGLLVDGNFESNGHFGFNSPIDANFNYDTDVFYTGNRSLKIQGSATYCENTNFIVNAVIDPNKTYEVGVWAKASKTINEGSVFFKGFISGASTNTDLPNFGNFALTTEWTYYKSIISGYEYNPADTQQNLALKLGITDKVGVDTTVWLDDFSLKEIAHTYDNFVAAVETADTANIHYSTDPISYIPYTFRLTNGETYNINAANVTLAIYDTLAAKQIAEENFTIDLLKPGQSYAQTFKILDSNVSAAYQIVATVSNTEFTKTFDKLGVSRLDNKAEKVNDYLGVCTHIAENSGSAEKIDQIADLGLGWASDDCNWQSVESSAGTYSISQNLIDYVNYCNTKGIKVRLNLTGFNSLYNGGELPTSVEDVKAFGNFCGYVAEVFAGKVDAYEIFSEFPYYTSVKYNDGQMVKEYIALLTAANNAIKAKDSAAKVLAIGLLRDWDMGFFYDFLQNNGALYCDAITVHPYEYANSPENKNIKAYLEAVIAALDECNVVKDLWVTEIGWSSSTQFADQDVESCSEQQQAAALVKSYFIFKQYQQIKMVQFYDLSDDGTDLTDIQQNYGLYRNDMKSAKLAVNAINTITQKLGDISNVSDITIGNGITGMSFKNSANKEMIVVWSSDKDNYYTVNLNANGNLKASIMDICGNTNEIAAANAAITVAISEIPVIITSDVALTVASFVQALPSAVTSPVIIGSDSESITLKAVDGYEYSIDGISWQTGTVFANINAGTVYTVYQRLANTAEYASIKATSDWLCGDINNNAELTVEDMSAFKKYLMGAAKCDANNADINGDGVIDIKDLIRIKKYFAGLNVTMGKTISYS